MRFWSCVFAIWALQGCMRKNPDFGIPVGPEPVTASDSDLGSGGLLDGDLALSDLGVGPSVFDLAEPVTLSDLGHHHHDFGMGANDLATGCPGGCDDGEPCTEDRCENGQCVHHDLPDGTSCTFGLAPNQESVCVAGGCQPSSVSCHCGTFGGGFGCVLYHDGDLSSGMSASSCQCKAGDQIVWSSGGFMNHDSAACDHACTSNGNGNFYCY